MAKAILNSIEYQTQSKFLEKNCCGIVEKKSCCCNDKIVQLHENSDKFQKEISQIEFAKIYFIESYKTIISRTAENFKIEKTKISYNFNDHLPPIFKMNCQLVFYA